MLAGIPGERFPSMEYCFPGINQPGLLKSLYPLVRDLGDEWGWAEP